MAALLIGIVAFGGILAVADLINKKLDDLEMRRFLNRHPELKG